MTKTKRNLLKINNHNNFMKLTRARVFSSIKDEHFDFMTFTSRGLKMNSMRTKSKKVVALFRIFIDSAILSSKQQLASRKRKFRTNNFNIYRAVRAATVSLNICAFYWIVKRLRLQIDMFLQSTRTFLDFFLI